MNGKCVHCKFFNKVNDSDYCSVECVRSDRLCARLKRIEDVFVELKYQVGRLEGGLR